MWIRFTRDFDFSPAAKGGCVTIAYKAGMTENVTRECATLAVAAGRGVRTTGEKESADGDADGSR